MTNIQTKDWDLRNAWPLATGEIAVREQLATIQSIGTEGLAAFTVKNQRTNVVWHYVLGTTTLSVYDENIVQVFSITHGVSLPSGKIPLTYAVVEDEIVISSPYLPTYWGIVGSGLIVSTKVTSVNPNTTAINIPRGLCVSWGGRVVMSDGASLYFSDALYPRTFVAENIVDPPGGVIYGLHVNAGGALIVVTSTGVYGLAEDASVSGQIVLGVFSKLTDYSAIDYLTSACTHGRVYGLTKKGYRLIDDAGSNETLLSENVMARINIPRIAFEDYRIGTILGGDHGPIVSIGGYLHMTDLATKTESWWTSYDSTSGNTKRFIVNGLLYDNSGEEMYVAPGQVYMLYGNRDDLVGANEKDIGVVAGRIVAPPNTSPVIRWIQFETDSEEDVEVFIRTTTKTNHVTPIAPVIGTAVWDSGFYAEVPLRSRQMDFAIRGTELAMELRTYEYPSRIPQVVDVTFKGPGKSRPNT